jgi:hypothetical protein
VPPQLRWCAANANKTRRVQATYAAFVCWLLSAETFFVKLSTVLQHGQRVP